MNERITTPEMAVVVDRFLNATSATARVVATHMLEFPLLGLDEKLDKNTKQVRTLQLDNAAAAALTGAFTELPFEVNVKGCEGDKERHMTKGGLEIDRLEGTHGNVLGGSVDVILDPVEGTTAACSRRAGSVVIIAHSESGGILPTPLQSEHVVGAPDHEVHYMYKLFAGPEMQGVLSLERDARYNVGAIADIYGPEGVMLVLMNRGANQEIIDAATKYGITPQLIEAGDLLPSLAAVAGLEIEGKKVVVYGRGGDQEGRIAAAAARTLGGFGQGQIWIPGSDENVPLPNLPIFNTQELVPGKPSNTGVVFTPITPTARWLDLPGYDDGSGVLKNPTSVAIVHKDAVGGTGSRIVSNPNRRVRVITN